MAISIVGTAQGGSSLNGGDVTLTFDVALQQNDVVILWGGHSHAAAGDVTPAVGPSTTGYTAIKVFDDPTNAEPSFGVWYKVMGATPDATVVGQGNGAGTDSTAYGCVSLRGQDLTTLQDAVATFAGPTSSTNPNGPAITTVTDNAWIITTAGSQMNDVSRGSVSGYTILAGGTANDTRAFSTDAAYLVKSPPNADDPAAWSTWNTGVWYTVTIAIRPAGAGAATYPGWYPNSTGGWWR